ncbi:uncharacterized protein L969DRAFT_15354 [Mixia osmundae IAM 14324]|uniref:uncharacterized protein n=1 Tax=Mixia osmundae (strain CBS 9802 / IAM 14324 / JCM 22182 / KY 12970) TaxID=764103 RepID=UPI0004A5558A|nr:uncharacterized protein L969DRAFT_15354 [Mixia osmundae IAM 14324]KEI41334.1 hypothetical protein L969DRAFT_15354 [Mixia osmundae IAM 14324]
MSALSIKANLSLKRSSKRAVSSSSSSRPIISAPLQNVKLRPVSPRSENMDKPAPRSSSLTASALANQDTTMSTGRHLTALAVSCEGSSVYSQLSREPMIDLPSPTLVVSPSEIASPDLKGFLIDNLSAARKLARDDNIDHANQTHQILGWLKGTGKIEQAQIVQRLSTPAKSSVASSSKPLPGVPLAKPWSPVKLRLESRRPFGASQANARLQNHSKKRSPITALMSATRSSEKKLAKMSVMLSPPVLPPLPDTDVQLRPTHAISPLLVSEKPSAAFLTRQSVHVNVEHVTLDPGIVRVERKTSRRARAEQEILAKRSIRREQCPAPLKLTEIRRPRMRKPVLLDLSDTSESDSSFDSFVDAYVL